MKKSNYKKGYKKAQPKLEKRVAKLEKELDPEVKYQDIVQTGVVTNNGLYGLLLNPIDQGVGDKQRIAEQIKAKDTTLRFNLKQALTATGTIFRVAIVLDKKPNVGATTWLTVFETASVNAMLNKDNHDRYKILYSKMFTLTSNGGQCKVGKAYVNLKNLLVKFNGSASNSHTENALYLVAISDEATVGNAPQFNWENRFNFYG